MLLMSKNGAIIFMESFVEFTAIFQVHTYTWKSSSFYKQLNFCFEPRPKEMTGNLTSVIFRPPPLPRVVSSAEGLGRESLIITTVCTSDTELPVGALLLLIRAWGTGDF